jgi:hypothetical protein
MKTRIKILTTLFSFILPILTVTPALSQAEKGFYTVKGVVKDKTTNKTLEYANIFVSGTNIGTVSNKDGEFTIKIKNELNAKTIEVSRIGYSSEVIAVKGVNIDNLVVYLSPRDNVLTEITILGMDPEMLIREAISRIGDNYSNRENFCLDFTERLLEKGALM